MFKRKDFVDVKAALFNTTKENKGLLLFKREKIHHKEYQKSSPREMYTLCLLKPFDSFEF